MLLILSVDSENGYGENMFKPTKFKSLAYTTKKERKTGKIGFHLLQNPYLHDIRMKPRHSLRFLRNLFIEFRKMFIFDKIN